MESIRNANNKVARLAPSLFFFLGLPIALWAEMYVPSKIFVAQDPVATANNLLANEFIFRTAIVGHLAGYLLFVFMMFLFNRLFRHVDKNLAFLMMMPLLAYIPIVFVSEVLNYTALMTLKSDARPTYNAVQQQETAYFLLRMFRFAIGPTKFFLGLSFIPFGMLILRSTLAPRIIGFLVIVAGAGYLIDSCSYILLDRSSYLMVGPYFRLMFAGFALALLWFLIKGVENVSSM